MMDDDNFEITLGADFERQLTCIPNVSVFKIPPLTQAQGYICSQWEGHQMWSGRLRVLQKGKDARIVLDDPNTLKEFAVCPLDNPNAVEPVVDSSRYFVLRVVNGGRHAFIGMGMKERNEAFDFNVACEEAKKNAREFEQNKNAPQGPAQITSSGKDYSLAPGQKITINIAGGSGTRKKRNVQGGGFKL